MNIIDAKGNLHNKGVLAVLSYSQYMPTEEKLNLLANKYEIDENVSTFACIEDEAIIGLIIVKLIGTASYEILSISIEPSFRGKGIGSRLISFIEEHFSCNEIYAETDNDAVGFYCSCGFTVKSLGEKYPGIVRYLCTLRLP